MSLTQSIKTCFQKYIDFSGRAGRSEFWWFFLFTLLVRLVTTWIPGLGFAIGLALLLPSLAVTARRLHDTNRTGWWMLLPIGLALAGIVAGVMLAVFGLFFIGVGAAIIGSIGGFLALLSFLIQPSDPGPNQYGPPPAQPQPDIAGYGYHQDPGPFYEPSPAAGGYEEAPLNPASPDVRPGAEPARRQFCTQCGMRLEPDARFCSVCSTPVE